MMDAASTPERSSAYACTVRHERLTPRRHGFSYRLFYLAIDLDELPALHRRLRLFSVNRANLFSLRERDYLPIGDPAHHATQPPISLPGESTSLKARALAFCAARGIELEPDARVTLVTLPRILGYQFNPVSFYFCHDRTGAPRAAIVEVTNTFREVKAYFVPPAIDGVYRLRTPKEFYVSPFSHVGVAFDFTLREPDAVLAIRIDDYDAGALTLHAGLTGRRVPLTDARLAWFFVRYPLLTLKVTSSIHWEAFRLWRKNVPFFRKKADAERQCDVYHAHVSISDPTP